ncbi:helix-turn-helix transcriptional regulator [Bradyrhizobium lablabi]|uniref:ATP-binding protein n=1 Tax=Bradyrhizobium lablabi TaxID=722472 RepID=UPI001BA7F404|nr:winged helix-turn-helix domain-containing protein [Bradyrhizobium lablabi]MBR1125440.1 helix-turn-helix transcriptional regulator [Bradyrhizobium lablabi]
MENSAVTSPERLRPGDAFVFGDFRLSPVTRSLTKAGSPIHLGGRALDILTALLDRAGQIVSKNELFAIVWPNRILEEANLRFHVAALRKALGDGLSGARFIVNVPGRGYVFVARVERTSDNETVASAPRLERPAERSPVPIPLVQVVGREAEIGEFEAQLLRNRFVTIIGAGGIGKTTVALAVVRKVLDVFRDGVQLVELGSLTGPLIAAQLASLLRLPSPDKAPLPDIVAHLRGRHMLLVFDNCEHVIAAINEIAETILQGAPEVRILATSREPLRAAGEWVHRLGPLAVPMPAQLTAAEALRFPAVALFAERAVAADPSCAITDDNAPMVAELCARLDGLPLAIELAAASITLLGLRGLVDRLDDRLSILTRGRRTALPRHQTLEAMIDWSFESLGPEERLAWLRFAVFPDAFSIEAAAAVANEGLTADFVDILYGLVEKSLVSVEVYDGNARYRLLESLRIYALKALTESGEAVAARRRHARYWHECALGYGGNWIKAPTADWLRQHSGDIPDIRAALNWAFAPDGDAILGIRLAVASTPLWFKLMLLHELRFYLEQAIQLAKGREEIDDALRIRLHTAREYSAFHEGRVCDDLEAENALSIAERAGDIDAQVQLVWMRWGTLAVYGDYESLMPWVERIGEIIARVPDHPAAAFMHGRMAAMTRHFLGEQAAAITHAGQVLERVASRRAAQDPAFVLTHDHKIGASMTYARALWLSGQPNKAVAVVRDIVDEMLGDGAEQAASAPPAKSFSLSFFLMWAACPISFWIGDLKAARKYVAMLLEVRSGINFHVLQTTGKSYERALHFLENTDQNPEARDGLVGDTSLNAFQAESVSTFSWKLLCPQPLADATAGSVNWCTAEILRARGEQLLETDGANRAEAEALFRQALDIARRQTALSWELRSAVSLARLWRDTGRAPQARTMLDEVYRRFTEGFATRDLTEARALLEAL